MEDAGPNAAYTQLCRRWRSHPLEFVAFFWPGMKLYPSQAKAIQACAGTTIENYVYAANKVGKCLDDDDLVPLANGTIVRAGDLKGRNFRLKAFRPGRGGSVAARSLAEDNGSRECIRITTTSGREIVRTTNHPLYGGSVAIDSHTMARTVDCGWRAAESLAVGDALLMVAKLDVTPVGTIGDPDAKLIAYFLGDGYIRRSPTFTQSEGPAKDEFRQLVTAKGDRHYDIDVLSIAVTNSRGKAAGGRSPSACLLLLREHGILGKVSGDKFIPDAVCRSSNRSVAVFLSRLYACDGWACVCKSGKAQIGYCTKSTQMARQIEILLLRFGVWCRMDRKRVDGEIYWSITITERPSIERFASQIGIFGKEAAVDRVVARAAARDRRKESKWHLKCEDGYRWERIKKIERVGQRSTTAICVPGPETFLTTFVEHNTRLAALAALWFSSTRFPAKVITSSSGFKQLRRVLWGEIGSLITAAKYDLGWRRNDMELFRVDAKGRRIDNHFCIGLVTNSIENFQGHHLDLGDGIPRTFCLFDESSGIQDAYHEAAQSWAKRMLILGNPMNTTNFFYKGCRRGNTERQSVIHIAATDTPNVQYGLRWTAAGHRGPCPQIFPGVITYEEYLHRFATWDRIKRRIRLEGLFFEEDGTLLFPPAWLDTAEGFGEAAMADNEGPFSLGIDSAGRGRDETVYVVLGPLGVRHVLAMHEADSMRIAGHTIRLMREFNIAPSMVCLDSGGGGKEIADRLREQGYDVRDISFGASARDRQYKNMRAELYGRLHVRMDPAGWREMAEGEEDFGVPGMTFGMPPEEGMLREELAILPIMLDSEGRLQLPPKDRAAGKSAERSQTIVLRDILGRSPDRADALVLAHEGLNPPGGFDNLVSRPLICA